ncbi:MAG: tryptophan synthase subunit alpha [Fimbriimonadaceae bacterium]|nr:tryptophan synthase subunit alpha [Fimbriimonadaceae bacterium]
MSLLAKRFEELRSRGEKALIPYVTAGDPALSELPAILEALTDGGADAIEIGLPFSDPIADGPVIQAASQRALDRGTTTQGVLDAIAGFDRVPLILMGYMNPIMRMGLGGFASAACSAGVSGVIVCDLTPEESDDWVAVCRSMDLDTIFLAAPTSTDARLDEVVRRCAGFVYAVSRTGVTGAESAVPPDVSSLVSRLKARTQVPVCVGFGISTPEHVRMVREVADGAVVGSSLVRLIAESWASGAGRERLVDTVAGLKGSTSL